MGRFLVLLIVVSAIVAGAAMYYLQVYAFYEDVPANNVSDVQLTARDSGEPETITYENFKAIDADSSPLRYRACFETPTDRAALAERFEVYEGAVPNTAPGWFDCFDAKALGGELEEGRATAFLGTGNIVYGFDRVVAVDEAGRGYVWHQLNACGQAAFDGDPLPPGCPPLPEN